MSFLRLFKRRGAKTPISLNHRICHQTPKSNLIDHFAAALPRRAFVEQLVLPPQEPNPRRGAHLVARRHQPITAQLLCVGGGGGVMWR